MWSLKSVAIDVHGCKCDEKQSGHMVCILSCMKTHRLLQKHKKDKEKNIKILSLTLLFLCLFLRLLSCSSYLTPTVLVGTV